MNSKMSKKIIYFLLLIVAIGLLVPQNLQMPVVGATAHDYHPDSFWYYPWGKSVTHKGVDIFATKGTAIHSSTNGIVLFTGSLRLGGKVVLVLGPKWRLHYYAHLDEISTNIGHWVDHEQAMGTVGTSGNATGKPPHLHYTILTLIPHPWRIDSSPQGWKKMFFLNPIDYF